MNGSACPDVLLRIPRQAHTLPGFRAWVLSDEFPEKLRATYVAGEVYLDMSKEEIRTHAAVKAEIFGTIWNLNQQIDFGDCYVDGVLVTNEEADVSNNPDGVAVLWKTLKTGRVRYVAKEGRELEIAGSPDWIMEIVSDGSVMKDTKELRDAYHRARIPEYWLIDARGLEVLFQILLWRKAGYVPALVRDGWQRSRVFGRSFRLTRTKDRRGAWKYRLLVKA
jgi:Uma2 family endonuclease